MKYLLLILIFAFISCECEPTQEGCETEILIEVRKVDNPTCDDKGCDGDIWIDNPQGPNVSYKWSNGNMTKEDHNLCSGLYTITITDNGKQRVTQVIIN